MDWHCQIIEPGRFYVDWKGKDLREIKQELESLDKKIRRRFKCKYVLWLICGNQDQIQFPQIQFDIVSKGEMLILSFWDRDGDFLFKSRRVSNKTISKLKECLEMIPKNKKRCNSCGRWSAASLMSRQDKLNITCRRCRKRK